MSRPPRHDAATDIRHPVRGIVADLHAHHLEDGRGVRFHRQLRPRQGYGVARSPFITTTSHQIIVTNLLPARPTFSASSPSTRREPEHLRRLSVFHDRREGLFAPDDAPQGVPTPKPTGGTSGTSGTGTGGKDTTLEDDILRLLEQLTTRKRCCVSWTSSGRWPNPSSSRPPLSASRRSKRDRLRHYRLDDRCPSNSLVSFATKDEYDPKKRMFIRASRASWTRWS